MKFDPNYYPKYNELSIFEKFILKTCCYFPTKQRRKREAFKIIPYNYIDTLTSAYGSEFWGLIKDKKVLGACLDVLEYEKSYFENMFSDENLPAPLQYLIHSDKVILSPHVAGWSHESFAKMAEAMVAKIGNVEW